MSKILVTGFEPFGGEITNPSAWILDKVKADSELSQNCETLLLPVTFGEAHKPVLEALKNHEFKAWVGFGQAGGRAKICLERVAINWQESTIADNSGLKPEPSLLAPGGEKAYFSRGPLEKMQTVLDLAGLPCEISFTAGAYVCNSLYYQVLSHLPESMWGLFVHVPYLKHQVEGKKGKPFLEEDQMWNAARLILQTAVGST